ncbi:MAG: hypothetical protein GC151_20780 [Betaproteobacteria bacterium]|nr:hypothetical protein [Betaproteobacteria bacterium]
MRTAHRPWIPPATPGFEPRISSPRSAGGTHRLSPIAYRLSPIAYRLSPIAYRLSPIAYRLSPNM